MTAACIIVAAGRSRRFGPAAPKQFALLKGKPLFLWSVQAFRKVREFSQIIVVVPAARLGSLKRLEKKLGVEFVNGGSERHDSVMNGVKRLRADIEVVAIHDAARPLVSSELISETLKAAKKYGACLAAVPARDTVKLADSKKGTVRKTIPRNEVWLAQTPQVFSTKILKRLYKNIGKANITDDAQLAEKLGIKVKIVEGSYANIKVTDKNDLKIVKMLLRTRNSEL
jgi:2-C-methyl-D-erythritol 4-phosphate cytidylyltransferase